MRYKFTQPQDQASVQKSILSTGYPQQKGHAVAKALNLVRTGVLVEANGYRGGRTVVIVVSDAADVSSKGVMSASASLRNLATVVAVGVGADITRRDLLLVAATERETLHYKTLADLERSESSSMIVPPLCSTLAVVPIACVHGVSNTTQSACQCRRRGCADCEFFDGTELGCLRCEDDFLHRGACVSTCPLGFVASEAAKRCIPASSDILRRDTNAEQSLEDGDLARRSSQPSSPASNSGELSRLSHHRFNGHDSHLLLFSVATQLVLAAACVATVLGAVWGMRRSFAPVNQQ